MTFGYKYAISPYAILNIFSPNHFYKVFIFLCVCADISFHSVRKETRLCEPHDKACVLALLAVSIAIQKVFSLI
jgi:hypothetical protein